MIEETVRLIWRSKLEPLTLITIWLNVDNSPEESFVRTFSPNDEDKAELEARYGPRPAG